MSTFSGYKTKAFSEAQKLFVLDPATGSPSFVNGSDLVGYLTPSLNYVYSETTRANAEATDYQLGQFVQTAGEATVGDGLAGVYLVVAGGTGDFPMQNGNDLLTVAGDDTLREQLISEDPGSGAALVSMEGGPTVEAAVLQRTIYVGSIAAMEALSLPAGANVYLTEEGRAGEFVVRAGDFSAQLASDEFNGVYIGLADDPTAATKVAERVIEGQLTPAMFGCLFDGSDETGRAQSWLNIAKDLGVAAIHDNGTLNVRGLFIPEFSKKVSGRGTIKYNGLTQATNEGLLEVKGIFSALGNGLTECEISNLTLDCSNGDIRGFFGSSMSFCVLSGLTVMSVGSGSTDTSGIRLNYSCVNNLISNNSIIMKQLATYAETIYGVQITSEIDGDGGWSTGNIVAPQKESARNEVINNYITGGSHAVSLAGVKECLIQGNTLRDSFHRSVHLSPASKDNIITENRCLDFSSAGIILAYGSNGNLVSGNTVKSSKTGGEAGIEVYVASTNNVISGNSVDCGANYAIYLAIDAINNVVRGNHIICNRNLYAGIAIESDWADVLPTDYDYSRPNYSPPPAPRTDWPNQDSTNNLIFGNNFRSGNNSIPAIYLSALGSVGYNRLNMIEHNTFYDPTFLYSVYIVDSSGSVLVQDITYKANANLTPDVNKSRANRGRSHFGECADNTTFNGSLFYSPPDGTATPSAFYSDKISLASYATATEITDFVDGMAGQEIMVRLATGVNIVNNSALIRTMSGSNITGNGNKIVKFIEISGIWFEV